MAGTPALRPTAKRFSPILLQCLISASIYIEASFSSISRLKSGFLTRRIAVALRPKCYFLSGSVPRDTCVCNEESGCLINPVCSGTACFRSQSRCATAEEGLTDRIPS